MRQRIKGMAVVWKLTLKRVLLRKSFWLILFLLPVMLMGLSTLDSEQQQGLRAVVYSEDAIWKEYLKPEGNPSFYFVDSIDALKTEVLRGDAECGYYLPKGLLEAFAEDAWYWKVEVYESSHSMFTKLMNEALFSHIFQMVSTQWYLDYMEERLEAAGASASKDDILQSLSQKVLNGETFQVETIRISDERGLVTTEQFLDEKNSEQAQTKSGNLLSAKGVVAAMVYLMSLLAVMDVLRDRENNHFPAKQRLWAAFWTICNPTLMVALIGLIGMCVSGTNLSVWNEVADLLVFVVLSTVYGMALSLVVRREKWMYGVIPVLFVACLVCCPVFVDLGRLMPIFQWIEKLFPVAFYL